MARRRAADVRRDDRRDAGARAIVAKRIAGSRRRPALASAGGAFAPRTEAASCVDGKPSRLSAGPLPEGAAFDPGSGVFTWTPTWAQLGSHEIDFGATDVADVTVHHAVVIDVSRNLRAIKEIDRERRFAIVEPGVIHDQLTSITEPQMNLTFAPMHITVSAVRSTASRDGRGGERRQKARAAAS